MSSVVPTNGRWAGFTSPTRYTIADVVRALDADGHTHTGDENSSRIRARCPVHGGISKRSLSVEASAVVGVLVRCHEGCSFRDIMNELGLTIGGDGEDAIPAHVVPPERHVYVAQKAAAGTICEAFPTACIHPLDHREIGPTAHVYKGKTLWVVSDNTTMGRMWRNELRTNVLPHTRELYDVILPGEATVAELRRKLGADRFRDALVDAVGVAGVRGSLPSVGRAPVRSSEGGGRRGRTRGTATTYGRFRAIKRAEDALRDAGDTGLTLTALWSIIGGSCSSADRDVIIKSLLEGAACLHDPGKIRAALAGPPTHGGLRPPRGRGRPATRLFSTLGTPCPICRKVTWQ